MHARRAIVLLVYLMSAMMSVALAKEYNDKRVQRPVGFNTMMRYGRTNPKDPRVPRGGGDLFFLGPRYGKRSSEWTPLPPASPPNASTASVALACGSDLACSYTGVADLYRCVLRKNHLDSNKM